MRVGLIASLAGHAAFLVWGLIAFPDAETFSVPPVDSLPVDLVPVEELTKLQKGEKDAEVRDVAATKPTETPVEKPAKPAEKPAKETKVERPTPPAPQPAPTPEPAPVAEPAPAPEPAPQEKAPEPAPAEKAPEPAPPAEPEPIKTKVVPRSKPKPPKPTRTAEKPKDKFNPNQISALLNKVEPEGGSNPASQDPASLGSRTGEENVRMTQSELDALRGQISRCWSPPVGAVGAEELVVRVRFQLEQSGEVSGSPEVLNSNSNPAFRAAASSAVRAVMRCAPYDLPAEKYDAWKDIIFNFDPREMIGG